MKANNESKRNTEKALTPVSNEKVDVVARPSAFSPLTNSQKAASTGGGDKESTSPAVVVPLQVNIKKDNCAEYATNPVVEEPKVAPVVPVSPSTYSFTNSDGVTVSVVQAVGLEELDSKELAAIAGEDGGNLNGEYALASYVDDVELGELVNRTTAVNQETVAE